MSITVLWHFLSSMLSTCSLLHAFQVNDYNRHWCLKQYKVLQDVSHIWLTLLSNRVLRSAVVQKHFVTEGCSAMPTYRKGVKLWSNIPP